MTLWRFLSRVFGCPHAHTYRERRDTALVLVCDACGASFPVNLTDHGKAKRLKARLKKSIRTPKHLAPVNDDYSPQIIEALLQRAKRLRKWGVTDERRTA